MLYGQSVFSLSTIETLFRLLRIGTVMVIPSFFYVAYIVFRDLELTKRSRWMPLLLNRYVAAILYVWSVFIYMTGWMEKGIKNLHPVLKGQLVNFLYPTYGEWSWMFMLHLGLYMVIISCSFSISMKVKDRVTRTFLLQFFGSATILYSIAIFNMSEEMALFSSGIACLVFSICIFSAFTYMNGKLIKDINLTLSEQKMFLRKILDANPNFISVKSRGGIIKDLNQSMASFYGTDINQAIGKREIDLIGEEIAGLNAVEDTAVLESFKDVFIPDLQVGDGGSARWFQTVKIPIMSANEPHILTISTDITQRKRDEEEKIRKDRIHQAI